MELYFRWRPQTRDPKDEMVLDTALNGRARYLVTHNSSDFLPLGHKFGIAIVSPARMLETI